MERRELTPEEQDFLQQMYMAQNRHARRALGAKMKKVRKKREARANKDRSGGETDSGGGPQLGGVVPT